MHAAETRIQQVPYLRACALCLHTAGQQPEPELRCRCPAFTGRAGLPCNVARAPSGPCGPEALHLDMVSWRAIARAGVPA